jgi:hypothetical protein
MSSPRKHPAFSVAWPEEPIVVLAVTPTPRPPKPAVAWKPPGTMRRRRTRSESRQLRLRAERVELGFVSSTNMNSNLLRSALEIAWSLFVQGRSVWLLERS